MTKRLLAFAAFALVMTGCQKSELVTMPSPELSADRVAETAAVKGTTSAKHWKGYYDDMYRQDGLPVFSDPDSYVHDTIFIHNGVAMMPYISGLSSFVSNIYFDIPSTYSIPGDSIILETTVQNLRSTGISDYDVVLELKGSLHSIQVHFVADSAFVSGTGYSLGTITKTNLPSLINYFGTFQSIKLTTKRGQTAVYVNNKLLYRFNYKTDNKIGDIRTIRLAGKGVPSFDYVKLTNSVTKKKKMTEDFNTEGQSHTIFY